MSITMHLNAQQSSHRRIVAAQHHYKRYIHPISLVTAIFAFMLESRYAADIIARDIIAATLKHGMMALDHGV